MDINTALAAVGSLLHGLHWQNRLWTLTWLQASLPGFIPGPASLCDSRTFWSLVFVTSIGFCGHADLLGVVYMDGKRTGREPLEAISMLPVLCRMRRNTSTVDLSPGAARLSLSCLTGQPLMYRSLRVFHRGSRSRHCDFEYSV